MLFRDGADGPVFRNIKTFFTYEPNKRIESTTYYYVNGSWVAEYHYFFQTNNLGLVQTTPIQPLLPSMLILGDSFTEGQGAPPWFEHFRESLISKDIQLINGGLIGTGFQQWKLLHDHLKEKGINVTKLVVIFISHDYLRSVWNYPAHTLACISDYNTCIGNENFYGKPPTEKMTGYLEKLRTYRMACATGLNEKIKYYLPATALALKRIQNILIPIEYRRKREIDSNHSVIAELITLYDDNVLFVHIPQKEETKNKRINSIGTMAVNDIKSLNGVLYDGLTKCGFNESDYHINDSHPNARGYEKVSKCVLAAVKDKWGLQ